MDDSVTLNDVERMVLDNFLSENWFAFQERAKDFMSEEEMESLAEKLAGH